MERNQVLKKLRASFDVQSLIVNAPIEFLRMIEGLPFETQSTGKKNHFDYMQIFATSKAELLQLLNEHLTAGKYDCLFWLCYPKGGGKITSDLNRNIVWETAAVKNIRPVTNVSIDETWSALRMRPVEAVK
jgi:hypothetical protein